MVKKIRYKKVVYDLGCGPWALDAVNYARKHPDTLVIAVDSRKVSLPQNAPPNVRLVRGNYYTMKLPYKADMIIFNFQEAVPDLFRTKFLSQLKPGGKIVIRKETVYFDSTNKRIVDYFENLKRALEKAGYKVEIRRFRNAPHEEEGEEISKVLEGKTSSKMSLGARFWRKYVRVIIKKPSQEPKKFKKIRKKVRRGPVRRN